MANIELIAIGKMDKNTKLLADDYTKRISKYISFKLIEINDKKLNEENPEQYYAQLSDILNKYIKSAYVISLFITGKNYSSVEFSSKINSILLKGQKIVFIIGGSIGLPEDIVNKSNEKLSFGKMTFPHKLFRIMLLEQLYRSLNIINNGKYHK